MAKYFIMMGDVIGSRGFDATKLRRQLMSLLMSEIYQIEPENIYSKGREKIRVEARSLFFYWAVRELGFGLTDLAKRLDMSQPGVGYAVSRGERIAKKITINCLVNSLISGHPAFESHSRT